MASTRGGWGRVATLTRCVWGGGSLCVRLCVCACVRMLKVCWTAGVCANCAQRAACARLCSATHNAITQVVRTLPGGKLELDTAAIRRRQDTIGSAYVPRGPHHRVTKQPGLGECLHAAAPVCTCCLVCVIDGRCCFIRNCITLLHILTCLHTAHRRQPQEHAGGCDPRLPNCCHGR